MKNISLFSKKRAYPGQQDESVQDFELYVMYKNDS